MGVPSPSPVPSQLPTYGAQTGRRVAQFPNRPSVLAERQMAADQGRTAKAPPPEPGPPGTKEITDFQWLLAWAALGLVLWLMARTALGYRIIYFTVAALILIVLLTQYKWVQAIFAPFAELGAGLTGPGGKNRPQTAQGNQAAYNPNRSNGGPRSAPRSDAAAFGAASNTAETASTLASL